MTRTASPAETRIVGARTEREHPVEELHLADKDPGGRNMGIVVVLRDLAERHAMTRRMLTEQKIRAVGTPCQGNRANDFSTDNPRYRGLRGFDDRQLNPGNESPRDALRILETAETSRGVLSTACSALRRQACLTGLNRPAPVSVGEVVNASYRSFSTESRRFSIS